MTTGTDSWKRCSVCKTEPLSGYTRLYTSEHTVEATYDGAVDCDPKGHATWILDGTPMGELQIPHCAVSPDSRGWGWVVVVVLAARRRRQRLVASDE